MNLLIIGNGFDLAHGLKTTYNDFLDWAYKTDRMRTYAGFDLRRYWESLSCDDFCTSRISLMTKYRSKNVFSTDSIPLFVETLFAVKNETWLALENNLADVVEVFATEGYSDRITLRRLFDNFLVPEFEFYIDEVINKTDILSKFPLLARADRVLSFNYSNTFERVYASFAEVCYVNGQADSSVSQSNIVFGCDYYDLKDQYLSWFNKIFQRASKHTDKRRIDWMKYNEGYDIDIVGHSLGKTDHDLLRPFIMNENNATKVYYHTENSKHELIYNMFDMVGGQFVDDHRIEFLPISALCALRVKK
ncbi:hypothetical protein FACS1894217_15940 [Clostridia bacterium]|nr:hypothetical protein FACS1894217_15940 [Clostridia bacterium]